MTDGRLALTTTVGVIAGVHNGTADGGTDALVTGLTGLTNLDGVVLVVTNLTDGSLAVQTDNANLTGGQTNLSNAVFLCDQLCKGTCGTNELCALAGVELNVVNESTNGRILTSSLVQSTTTSSSPILPSLIPALAT